MVNQYDGIDLPKEACRILVLDGLPDVRGRLDKVEQGLLVGSEEAVRSSMLRVEQGMGRGIRSKEDFCAVFLMGRSLTRQLYVQNAKTFFTPATRAQLELSEQLATQMLRPTVPQMHSVVKRFMEREKEWVRASKAAVVRAKSTAIVTLKQSALSQRQSFNSASCGDFRQACADMQAAIDAEKDPRVQGWLLWQLAEFEHRVDAARSQQTLKQAIRRNTQIVRPMEGIGYVRLPGQLANQASLCLQRLQQTYASPNDFVIDMNAHLDALVFQPETAERFERTLTALAELLGFGGQQPERDFGRGPDVLWSIGQQRFLVIECKNGATVETICKDYCNQLTGSMVWFQDKYGTTCHAMPLMVHPGAVVEYAATMHPDARIMRSEQLEAFRGALRDFATALASKPRFGTEQDVAAALAYHKLTAEHFLTAYSVKPRKKA